MGPRVLVVDDQKVVTEVVERYLRRDGYEVALAPDGATALRLAREWAPNLIILDLMLPNVDGLEVCRRIRGGGSSVPIIILTARGQETDRVVGLELGAYDYVSKPFSPRELVARVRSVLRRASPAPGATIGGTLRFDSLTVDPHSRVVLIDGHEAQLTARSSTCSSSSPRIRVRFSPATS